MKSLVPLLVTNILLLRACWILMTTPLYGLYWRSPSKGKEKAKHCHDYTLTLLYSKIGPHTFIHLPFVECGACHGFELHYKDSHVYPICQLVRRVTFCPFGGPKCQGSLGMLKLGWSWNFHHVYKVLQNWFMHSLWIDPFSLSLETHEHDHSEQHHVEHRAAIVISLRWQMTSSCNPHLHWKWLVLHLTDQMGNWYTQIIIQIQICNWSLHAWASGFWSKEVC